MTIARLRDLGAAGCSGRRASPHACFPVFRRPRSDSRFSVESVRAASMKTRVTQTDIARVAGVHNTTVSLALRRSPLIPDETRRRIQTIAEELGYSPDPTLRALVPYRNSSRESTELGTLAYVTDAATPNGWRELPGHESYFNGARRQAAANGYQLAHFWLGEAGMSQRRLSATLAERGILGAIFACHRAVSSDLSGLDWMRVSAVTVGMCPQVPAINRVMEDHVGQTRLALHRARAAGHRRVGFALESEWDDLTGQAWSSACQGELFRLAATDVVPLLRVGNAPASGDDSEARAALHDWYRGFRPDVVIGLGASIPARLAAIDLNAPAELGYLALGLGQTDGAIAGVHANGERVGELAVSMLSTQLLQAAFGPPRHHTVTTVAGTWCAGRSLLGRA